MKMMGRNIRDAAGIEVKPRMKGQAWWNTGHIEREGMSRSSGIEELEKNEKEE